MDRKQEESKIMISDPDTLKLYRKRIIPEECLLLKGDKLIRMDDEVIITSWTTINPKTEFSHGCSCGYGVSRKTLA